MTGFPSADDLLDAAARRLEEVAAEAAGRELFLTRVALGALDTARRELRLGAAADARACEVFATLLGLDPGLGREALEAELCRRIRSGRLDAAPELPAALRAVLIDQVEIDQPRYSGLAEAKARLSSAGGSGSGGR